MKVRLARFAPETIKWDEVPDSNGCPHLYGNFGAEDVVAVKKFERLEGQTWTEALGSQGADFFE
jgi:hypothetical protein